MSKRSMYLTWLLVFLVTGLIYSAIVFQLSAELFKKTSDIKADSINSLRNEFNSSIILHEQVSLCLFNDKINQPWVLESMSNALNAVGTQQQSQLRSYVYEMLYDDYTSISHYGFLQMHFHFRDGTSFLRMHQPELFGDPLFESREIVKQANIQQKYMSGFEIDRIKSGFRFVYPLFYENSHIGTMELAVPPETIINMLNAAFPDEYHEFILQKALVDQVTDPAKSYYMDSMVNDNFYYDMDAYLANNGYWDESGSALVNKLRAQLKQDPQLEERLQNMNDFALEETAAGVNYLISFALVKNYQGHPVAYLISYSANEQLPAVRSAYSLNILLLSLLYLIFAGVSWYFVKSRIKFEMQANIDPLTLVFNRYKFLELATMEVEKFRRYRRPLSIILFDLDYFKKVNDNYGHAAGDYVLKTVAQIINQNKRSADLFARWGGEEFILLLPETPLHEALAVADRLRSSLASYDFEKCHQITASFGVAELETSDENLDALIEKVDQALYKAKNNGRNRVEEYRSDEPYLFN